jgi:hypothetical protein
MPPPRRPLVLTLFFSLYFVGAAAFVALAIAPGKASEPSDDLGVLRIGFAFVALANGTIGAAALRRSRRVRPLAFWLHVLVAAFAASGLAAALAGRAFIGDDLPSLAVKALTHALLALVWSLGAVKRYFA